MLLTLATGSLESAGVARADAGCADVAAELALRAAGTRPDLEPGTRGGAPVTAPPAGLLEGTDGGRDARCPHPDALLALEMLAFGLQRRRDHQLRAVELGDVPVSARGHRRS